MEHFPADFPNGLLGVNWAHDVGAGVPSQTRLIGWLVCGFKWFFLRSMWWHHQFWHGELIQVEACFVWSIQCYTPENERPEPKNHPIAKDNHLKPTSMFWFQPLIFMMYLLSLWVLNRSCWSMMIQLALVCWCWERFKDPCIQMTCWDVRFSCGTLWEHPILWTRL